MVGGEHLHEYPHLRLNRGLGQRIARFSLNRLMTTAPGCERMPVATGIVRGAAGERRKSRQDVARGLHLSHARPRECHGNGPCRRALQWPACGPGRRDDACRGLHAGKRAVSARLTPDSDRDSLAAPLPLRIERLEPSRNRRCAIGALPIGREPIAFNPIPIANNQRCLA